MDNGDRSAQLQASARGWLTVQLAVLGFVGLCGALKSGGGTSAPRDVEVVAGVLVLLALALACLATYLVGRTAWPLLGARGEGDISVERAGRRLGLVLTFVAVALVAAAAAAAWWPQPERPAGAAGLVEVTASTGTWCGTLGSPGQEGAMRLRVSGQAVDIPVADITAVSPVADCA
ncbi:hypothetical protein [Streptomyces sp. ISL-86]|uniref:hypothetical protein n=1 Tax=Streptomyces sp. ISL-86 TaxID=2819187 RepID=UPI001BED0896|nr:hypothetical protein [Streptomyces sp. ISL-86]MBT2455534.1 hypothetical protein [Streptomyces sp. ISL-86]